MEEKDKRLLIDTITEKARWVRKETLKIHKIAQGTRIASSLSCVEIFSVLYYGKILRHNPKDTKWDGRDRLIVSKGHGSICFYPIVADMGYFNMDELARVCREGSFLGAIPDPIIPGYETVNGSLGHGIGVGCGMALALKRKGIDRKVFVIMGDGELYEGAVWEAVMFAGQHKLSNLIVIIDNNKACMLGFCRDIIDLEPIGEKFTHFHWNALRIDGHNVETLYDTLRGLTEEKQDAGQDVKQDTGRDADQKGPTVVVADTIKGKGIPALESDPISHIRNISPEEIDKIMVALP